MMNKSKDKGSVNKEYGCYHKGRDGALYVNHMQVYLMDTSV